MSASAMETEMLRRLREFYADESGATAIEYALIASGIALAIITTVNSLGVTLGDKFAVVKTSLN
jgi:pilus assembly protein Flp/PilA